MSGKVKIIIFLLSMLMITVMTSGCITNKSDEWRSKGLKYCETTKKPEPFNFTTAQWIIPEQTTTPTATNKTSQGGNTQNSPDGTAQKSSSSSSSDTKTSTSTPKACSHSWTQKYIGYDSSTGKIRYRIYCSKCGEVANDVWY
jgi:hypothetical protein